MRTARSPLLFPALLCAIAACDPPALLQIDLPQGLPIAELSEEQQGLLRATLAISQGALPETEVTLDVAAQKIRGEFALQNVTAGGQRNMTLRVYGRFSKDTDEVLLGAVDAPLTVSPQAEVRVSFAGEVFATCEAGPDGQCALLFDENRNRAPNILDLTSGIDPAQQAPFLEAAPATLQFWSGIPLGAFGRQVVVLENRGRNPIRIVSAEVVGGQGVTLSLFDPENPAGKAPRRAIDSADLTGLATIAAKDEVLLAVSFAPVNLFLTTGAVQIVVEDTVTHVTQTARTKVIANAQGTLRPPAPDYLAPALNELLLEDSSLPATAFPTPELFSGLVLTAKPRLDTDGADAGSSGDANAGAQDAPLARSGAVLVLEDASGAPVILPADRAFVVDVPAGQWRRRGHAGRLRDVGARQQGPRVRRRRSCQPYRRAVRRGHRRHP